MTDHKVFMTVDELISNYGLCPHYADRSAIRSLIKNEIRNVQRQGNELLKTLCIQLFSLKTVQDSLLIWEAKQSSFDASIYIDAQSLCGAGLLETKAFLARHNSQEARTALKHLEKCENSGGFIGFSVAKYLDSYRAYYGLE